MYFLRNRPSYRVFGSRGYPSPLPGYPKVIAECQFTDSAK
jgi:hypothetical protein